MRLADLEPRWVGAGGEGVRDASGNPEPERHGVGLSFRCPCGRTDHRPDSDRVYVALANPLDGGAPHISPGELAWQRTGDTFETLTLSPSILRTLKVGCGWHGWIRNGEVITC